MAIDYAANPITCLFSTTLETKKKNMFALKYIYIFLVSPVPELSFLPAPYRG